MNPFLIALGALGLTLTACGGSSAGGDASPRGEGQSSSSSSPAASSSKSSSMPATAVQELTFQVNPGGTAPDASLEVGDGFIVGADWYVVSEDGDAFLGLWTAGQVERDACRRPLHDGVNPGPTVRDLADALVRQRSTRATAPEPVKLAGLAGLFVRVTGPGDLDNCDEDPSLTNSRGIYSDHQVDRIWILDADGRRVVVDASYAPTATATEVAALRAMVRSLQLV